ncbi:MAG: hypothetical protein KKA81_15950, partial [Bacteroidetes bacterium]|nr:hypothetical protein [Bacteroidota bacterium]
LMGAAASVSAQETVADRLGEALNYYNDLEYDMGIAVGDSMLMRTDLSAQDSVAIYEVLSILTYAKGQKYQQQSFDFLERISQIGPCLTPMPQEIWPQELRDRWYRLIKDKNALTCPKAGEGITTIAIMKFDNFSTGKYQEELGLLSKGLADFFAYDFGKVSDLTVIERDKIDFILKEIALQQSGAVNQATAVKVGQILGAKYMVFGSITQIDGDNTRMVVRVVDVETSEIVASVDKEGKPKYSEMEKALVKELAEALDLKLNKTELSAIDESGTSSNDAMTYYSRGLQFMDEYDYREAYENFKKAYELDPSFAEAKRKMEIYRPLAS